MKRFITFLATILLLVSSGPLSGPVAAKDRWLSVRSKNFLLLGNANEKQIRQVGIRLEQFREAFAQMFPNAVHHSPVPTTVVVFKSDDSYRPFKPNENVAGYFQAGQDVNYITLTTEVRGQQDPFAIIFHEYTHLLINNTTPNMPLWFNEGLAEYYSTFSIRNNTDVIIGSPISSHVFLLRENRMLPLRTLFKVDDKSPYYNEGDKQSVFYAESWALIHYLILGKDGQRFPQMGNFLKLIAADVPLEAAFQQAFATSFENMEKELHGYVQRDRYPIFTGHFQNKLVVETEMQTLPISDAEVQAYLGDMLVHSYRDDSEDYLQRSLKLDPNQPMANASLAMLRLRQGKMDQARDMLARAAANSGNFLIHYYYAYALSREGSGEMQEVSAFAPEAAATMRAELKKAIELRPDFFESHSLLAFVNLVTDTNIAESVEMLKQALVSVPSKSNLQFMLAQLYTRQENYQEARALLERLSGNKSDDEVRLRAKVLLDRLGILEGEMTRYRAAAAGATPSADSLSSIPDGPVAAAANLDPSFSLRQALRKPAADELQVQGVLERIDCDAKSIVFIVRIGGKLLKLKTNSFEDVKLKSYSSDAGHQITCGQRKPANNVVICYLTGNDPRKKVDGTITSLEFVPPDFQLEPGRR